MKITTRAFFGATLMPRILPQIKSLFGTGFGHVAYYIAQIFVMARLLPPNHAYANVHNLGRFGVAMVIIEAARNLRFTRANIDQITIFALIILGAVLLMFQIGLLLFSFFIQTANAQIPISIGEFFITPDPTNDVAFVMLDRVFGVPGLYESCVSTGTLPCLESNVSDGPFPFPYHTAFHDMLMFYSIGVAVIGLLIFMYYIVAIAVETAQTGTPFGRRFNHVWAPIRMVVALGLLVPMSMGFNGAQMLTLYVAKWGSSFATNGWTRFVDVLVTSSVPQIGGRTYDADGNIVDPQMVGDPRRPPPNELLRFYTVLAACYQLYDEKYDITVDAYLIRSSGAPQRVLLTDYDFDQARTFFNNGPFVVVYGEHNARHTSWPGQVKPYCGEVTFTPTQLTEPGALDIQSGYYDLLVRQPWRNINGGAALAPAPGNLPAPSNQPQGFFRDAATNILDVTACPDCFDAMLPNDAARNAIVAWWEDGLTTIIAAGVAQMRAPGGWVAELNELGWGGAGIWYNKIAEMNGGLMSAVSNLPSARRWPIVMEYVAEEKTKNDKNAMAETLFLPYLADGSPVNLPTPGDWETASTLYTAYSLWNGFQLSEFDGVSAVNAPTSKNTFVDFVNAIFGTQGLFNMRDNTDVHPLAQLVIMGKHLLFTSIRNLALSAAGSASASLAKILSLEDVSDTVIKPIASLLGTIGMMTLSIGFILYYVIPFLPFIYFFFQVGGWVKALFEAMVGLPLWALAHIRIDGQGGLPSDAAISGYFLIFEIFLRPILTIFGLIGGISIFAAQVQVLNQVFKLVVSNVTGFDMGDAATLTYQDVGAMAYVRSGIDQLFYTVIYVIIVYMMAQASFKLVYLIPNNILRWMNSSVDGFGELAKDEPGNLVGTVYGSSIVITGQLGGVTSAALNAGRR